MTESEPRRSLVDQLRDERPLDAAAARAAVRAVGLMNEAFALGDLGTRRELAEAVGVSEGRISQLLNGDGNVRMSTLARLLKASGFDLELSLAGVRDVPRPSARRREKQASRDELPTYVTVRAETAVSKGSDGPGIERHRSVEFSSRHPRHEVIGSEVEWTGSVEFSDAAGRMGIRYVDANASAPGRTRNQKNGTHA